MIECNENEKIVVDGVTYYKPIEKKEKKRTGWEEPEEGKSCYFLATYAPKGITMVTCYKPQTRVFDEARKENASVFADEDFAEQYARHETLWRRIAKWQAENDEPVAYKDCNSLRFLIYYDYEIKMLGPRMYYQQPYNPNTIVFSTFEKCMECIEVFREDLEWDMNEFKWRLDGE